MDLVQEVKREKKKKLEEVTKEAISRLLSHLEEHREYAAYNQKKAKEVELILGFPDELLIKVLPYTEGVSFSDTLRRLQELSEED